MSDLNCFEGACACLTDVADEWSEGRALVFRGGRSSECKQFVSECLLRKFE